MRRTIADDSFNADTDFILIRKDKAGTDHMYSTAFTLVDLEYDAQDVINTLNDLKVEEYSESVFDNDDSNPFWLHVFGKEINDRLVYIKLKIREAGSKYIICVSFHYAKNSMVFPYR